MYANATMAVVTTNDYSTIVMRTFYVAEVEVLHVFDSVLVETQKAMCT